MVPDVGAKKMVSERNLTVNPRCQHRFRLYKLIKEAILETSAVYYPVKYPWVVDLVRTIKLHFWGIFEDVVYIRMRGIYNVWLTCIKYGSL